VQIEPPQHCPSLAQQLPLTPLMVHGAPPVIVQLVVEMLGWQVWQALKGLASSER
jgi:hypothetical protein